MRQDTQTESTIEKPGQAQLSKRKSWLVGGKERMRSDPRNKGLPGDGRATVASRYDRVGIQERIE